MENTLEHRVETIEMALGRFILENDRALKRLESLIERSERRADTDRARAEEDRQRSTQDRKDWNKKWGELANKLGTIVEDIVAPNLPRIAREYLGCGELDDFMV